MDIPARAGVMDGRRGCPSGDAGSMALGDRWMSGMGSAPTGAACTTRVATTPPESFDDGTSDAGSGRSMGRREESGRSVRGRTDLDDSAARTGGKAVLGRCAEQMGGGVAAVVAGLVGGSVSAAEPDRDRKGAGIVAVGRVVPGSQHRPDVVRIVCAEPMKVRRSGRGRADLADQQQQYQRTGEEPLEAVAHPVCGAAGRGHGAAAARLGLSRMTQDQHGSEGKLRLGTSSEVGVARPVVQPAAPAESCQAGANYRRCPKSDGPRSQMAAAQCHGAGGGGAPTE